MVLAPERVYRESEKDKKAISLAASWRDFFVHTYPSKVMKRHQQCLKPFHTVIVVLSLARSKRITALLRTIWWRLLHLCLRYLHNTSTSFTALHSLPLFMALHQFDNGGDSLPRLNYFNRATFPTLPCSWQQPQSSNTPRWSRYRGINDEFVIDSISPLCFLIRLLL